MTNADRRFDFRRHDAERFATHLGLYGKVHATFTTHARWSA
jgi:hypothetical protein